MGHVSIVYGNIIGATWNSNDYHKLQKINKSVIDSLPSTDNNFPWITKKMFLVPNPETDNIYREQVIVFGASYKTVEHEWEQWLLKFEKILRQLYWLSATIHLESELVGSYKYEWICDTVNLDNWFLENPKPIDNWEFKGGPRSFS